MATGGLTTGTSLEAFIDPLFVPSGDILDEMNFRWQAQTQQWGLMQDRNVEIAHLIRGDWNKVFPDEFDEEPSVANIFRVTTEDGGRLFSEVNPFIRVDPDAISDKASKRAERRERILHAYLAHSSILNRGTKELFGQDMIAAGMQAIRVWPDLGAKPNKRFPRFRRIDPRFVLPDVHFAPDIPTDNVIIAWRDSPEMIRLNFPLAYGDILSKGGRDDADYDWFSVEFYSSRYTAKAIYAKPRGVTLSRYNNGFDWQGRRIRATLEDAERPNEEARLVAYIPNPTGICPVQIALRPNWSLEPMGQLDDSKGIVRTQNRYFRLLLDYFIRMVYGGKVAWNIDNPFDSGPDTVYRALGPDGKMDPVTPGQASFQAYEVLDRLDAEARTAQIAPRAREGQVDLNKASAAFLHGAQGQLNSVTRSHQEVFANTLQIANEAAFAQDRAWCDVEKDIIGRVRGQRFKDRYKPSRDIKKDEYANRVEYGTQAGNDPSVNHFQTIQQFERGLMAEETAMERLGEDDVPGERQRKSRQQIENGIYAILADPTLPVEQIVPTLKPRLAALAALQKEGADVSKVVAAIEEAMAPPAAPEAPPGAPPGAAPLGAPGAVPPEVTSGQSAEPPLPAMADLIAQFGNR